MRVKNFVMAHAPLLYLGALVVAIVVSTILWPPKPRVCRPGECVDQAFGMANHECYRWCDTAKQ